MLNKERKNERIFVGLFNHKYESIGIYNSRRHELYCSIVSLQGTITSAIWDICSGAIFQPYGYKNIGLFYFSDKTRDKILYQVYYGSKFSVAEATRMWKVLENKYFYGIE